MATALNNAMLPDPPSRRNKWQQFSSSELEGILARTTNNYERLQILTEMCRQDLTRKGEIPDEYYQKSGG